jgi:hypothetical protein
MDGGVPVIDHLVQGLDFVALDGLFIPLPGAQPAKAESQEDEEVDLQVLHKIMTNDEALMPKE